MKTDWVLSLKWTVFSVIAFWKGWTTSHSLSNTRTPLRRTKPLDNINLAVKRVAPTVVQLSHITIEQQVTILTQAPAWITHADTILTTVFTLIRQRAYKRNEFPTTRRRIDASLRIEFELWLRAFGCVELVQL